MFSFIVIHLLCPTKPSSGRKKVFHSLITLIYQPVTNLGKNRKNKLRKITNAAVSIQSMRVKLRLVVRYLRLGASL